VQAPPGQEPKMFVSVSAPDDVGAAHAAGDSVAAGGAVVGVEATRGTAEGVGAATAREEAPGPHVARLRRWCTEETYWKGKHRNGWLNHWVRKQRRQLRIMRRCKGGEGEI
jgi:hypothetical protein